MSLGEPRARRPNTSVRSEDAAGHVVRSRGVRLENIRRDERAGVGDFYGIKPGEIPGLAEAGGAFMSVTDLPGHTVRHMAMFMERLRGMHTDDALAFELCVRHVAGMIEDQRRNEGRTDPRENPAP